MSRLTRPAKTFRLLGIASISEAGEGIFTRDRWLTINQLHSLTGWQFAIKTRLFGRVF